MDYVLHEAPDDFEKRGSVIVGCPSCAGKEVTFGTGTKNRLTAIAVVGDLLGDDVDGYAAFIEDMGLDGEGDEP